MASGAIRVCIVDDHPVVRDGLATVLAAAVDVEVAGTAGSCSEAVETLRSHNPDVTLLDFRLQDGTAVDILRDCQEIGLSVTAAVLSSYGGAWDIYHCLKHGAKAFLLKEMPSETLLEAIRALAKGLRFIPPDIAAKASEAMCLDALTARELDVLQEMASGLSNKAIAHQLGISEGTVKTHVNNILLKIQAESRTDAVVRAFRFGLARLDPTG
ncbi:MAG: response regulator transcription factor [Myxococcota bacterium]